MMISMIRNRLKFSKNIIFKISQRNNNNNNFTTNSNNNHRRRVVVTGIGLLSPLGLTVEKSWNSLLESKSGITKLNPEHLNDKRFNDIPCRIAGYIPDIEQYLQDNFNKNQLRTYSRSNLYTILACNEAIKDSGWNSGLKDDQINDQSRTRLGVNIGSGMINFEDVIDANKQLESTGFNRFNPHFITKVLLNIPSGQLSIQYQLLGPNHCVSTACTTGAHSIGDAYNFIRLNYSDLMICGGVEAPINPLSFASFCRIRALCCKFNDRPEKASRPFDQDRFGFVMGESAAILILEELNHAKNRNARIYGEILGYGLSSDAYHITSPSNDGRGAKYSMLSALNDAKIDLKQIGHINCHATSTPLGDQIELNAIQELFQEQSPSSSSSVLITSTKGSTGHLLGAAGAAEAIFTILSCYHGKIPPTLNLENPIEHNDPPIKIVGNRCQSWIDPNGSSSSSSTRRIALTNSFGFGGTNATLVISNFVE